MISRRLLSKLEIGKKYAITDGIRFFYIKKDEDVMFAYEIGFSSNGLLGIYMKDWDTLLRENLNDSAYVYHINNVYDKTNPTYCYYAHITSLFASGPVDLSLYGLHFLGEYNSEFDIKKAKTYCNIFKISFKWKKRKERLEEIYGKIIFQDKQ